MRQLKISKQITNRESQSLDKYLQEIGKVDLITAEVEVELAKRIREGDQAALEKLTKANNTKTMDSRWGILSTKVILV
jgi:RNA polymerase primary sigma factor